ncbi:hypothetical protein AN403_4142 [Pseudomonas fluorescens]|uniref:Uncharacterized protein n=1 Tax=Pseudomonas fluorescens TaxID=294 RepID=A0A0P8X3G7_PSEFL|nr:hypothetical protein AN403_4142 [Pseudomonas fluorescens]
MAPAGVIKKESAWRCFPFLEYFSEMPASDFIARQLLVDIGNTSAIFRRLDHQRIVFQNERPCDGQTYRLAVRLILPGVKFATGKTPGNARMVEQVAGGVRDPLRGQICIRSNGHERLRCANWDCDHVAGQAFTKADTCVKSAVHDIGQSIIGDQVQLNTWIPGHEGREHSRKHDTSRRTRHVEAKFSSGHFPHRGQLRQYIGNLVQGWNQLRQ